MFFQRIYYICFRFLFLVLFLCLFLVLMLVSILLLMLLGRPWGILSPFLSFSGMPFSCFSCSFGWLGAYFFLTFLFPVCLFPTFHALSDGLGHTFFSPFSFWYAFCLLFTLFWMLRGILFPFFSFSGMPFSCFSCSFKRPVAYFFLFFHFWYVYLAVFETYAKMIDARHLTGLSLDRIFYQADCA